MANPPDKSDRPALPPLSGELRLGSYVLGKRLGEGGMGVVYLARDLALDREVAIKILRVPQPVSQHVVKRFIREAKNAARLNHPNIVTIHQFGESDGQLYLVMEHIEGGSLADEIHARGALPWQQATRAIRDAAVGLGAAHEVGLVHRDIKPSNLMRTPRGDVKLVDFGLARLLDVETDVTLQGMVVGTPQYMAPEQYSSDALDSRSDLYALICTYYALLTGRAPFVSDELTEVLRQHQDERFPDPRQIVGDIPESVCGILERGSRKLPGERFQTAGEMLAALDAVLIGAAPPPKQHSGSREQTIAPPADPRTPLHARSRRAASTASFSTGDSSAPVPNNIPTEVTTFIGRARELADVLRLLETAHGITLTGPGGTGKTRLALRVAAESLALVPVKYPDGVWFVELASLSQDALVAQAVAQVLNISEERGHPLIPTICQNVARRRLLLILDNCEHVIGPCARLAEALIRSGPGVSVLATSREALGVAGEALYPVPPLGLPDTVMMQSLESEEGLAEKVLGFEAVRLFVDRATAIAPDFRLTDAVAPHVGRICRKLDGIPLAIELAAARAGAISVEQIAERLEDRFRLLTRGSRTALPRQQTLRALIDWSYDLLDHDERLVLARLSVFAGGWSLEAAEAVASGEGIDDFQVLDLLSQLVNKSLVNADTVAGAKRYRMLETVKQYAAEKLEEAPDETRAARDRHLEFFLRMTEAAEPHLMGPISANWTDRLEVDLDNLRAAMDWGLLHPGRDCAAMRITAALGRFWIRRGYFAEARRRLDESLARSDSAADPRYRAAALYAIAYIAVTTGDLSQGARFSDESLRLYELAGDAGGIAHVMALNATEAVLGGDYLRAETLFPKAMERLIHLSDRKILAATMYNFALAAHYRGDFRGARERFGKAIEYARELQDVRHTAIVSMGRAFAITFGGEPDEAISTLLQTMQTFKEMKDAQRVANAQYLLAFAFAWRGDSSTALEWCDRCLRTLGKMSDRLLRGLTFVLQGQLVARGGDCARGVELCQKSLVMARESGDNRGVAWAMMALAWIAARSNDRPKAAALYAESLVLSQRLPDWRNAVQCLEGMAALEASDEDPKLAARFLAWAAAIREQIGCPLSLPEKSDLEPITAILASRRGAEASAVIVSSGETSTPAQIVQTVLALLEGSQPRI